MNPIFIEIGGFKIYYYGLMYAVAFFVGVELAKRTAKRYNISADTIDNYGFVAMLSGLLGGRLYYVIFNWGYYSQHLGDVLAVWKGGMAIHGGIIGGIIGTAIYAKIKKLNPLILADIAAPVFLLGQALGRIGNLMNGEVHGVPTFTPLSVIFSIKPAFYEWYAKYNVMTLSEKLNFNQLVPWGVTFPTSSPAGAEFPNLPLHPAMMYESIFNFLGFLFMWFLLRNKNLKAGKMSCAYIVIYNSIRIFVSFFRAEDLMIGGLRAPHLTSLVLILIAVAVNYFIDKKEVKAEEI